MIGYTVMCGCGFFCDRLDMLTATRLLATHRAAALMLDLDYCRLRDRVLEDAVEAVSGAR